MGANAWIIGLIVMVPRSISRPFYHGKQWQKTRDAYIKSVGGLCERCLTNGKVKPGYIVHHKHYITADNINDPSITLSFDNLEYLCFDCHQEEHFGKVKVVDDDLKFDSNGDIVQKTHKGAPLRF